MSEVIRETPNVLVRLKYYPPNGGGTYSNSRPFYSGGVNDDYMKYIEKGIADGTHTESVKWDYMAYVGDGGKTAGVFGKDGFLSKEQKAEIRKQLRDNDSNVWDMIISFKTEYGNKYMRDAETAQALLKARLHRFFKAAGLIPDNMIWFAGLHTNSDNRHLHVCFFEKKPVFLRRGKKDEKHFHHGKLLRTGIDAFKLGIEKYFSGTALQFKTERAEIIAAARDALNYDKRLKDKVSRLSHMLSDDGLLGYDSANMRPYRKWIDAVTKHILTYYPPAREAQSKLSATLGSRDYATSERCRLQKIKNVNDFLVYDKVMLDLYRRIGNQVIMFAVNTKRKYDVDRNEAIANPKSARRRITRKDFLRSLKDCLKLGAIAEAECMGDFADYIRRLEAAMPRAQYERDQPQNEKEEACL